jgi:hypothetical protein
MLVFPLLYSVGCQQSITSRLAGAWIGRPDTAAAAAARSAKLKANQNGESNPVANLPSDDAATAELGKTYLEQHDVTIHMSFAGDKNVRMSLGDGSEPLAGVWRVVSTLPPDGAEIEISLNESEGDQPPRNEKRRFIVDFQQNGAAPGFTLIEKGADPQFGRMYFTKRE